MNGSNGMRALGALAIAGVLAACQASNPTASPAATGSAGPTAVQSAATPSAPIPASAGPTPCQLSCPHGVPTAVPASAPPSASTSPAVVTPAPIGSWVAAGSIPEDAWVAIAARLGDGGAVGLTWDGTTATRWDPDTGTWRRATGLAIPRSGPAVVTLPDGRVLVVGGVDTRDPEHWRAFSSAYVYGAATPDGTWTKVGLMGTARVAPAAAVLRDGRVLVAGGSYIDGPPYQAAGAAGLVLAAFRPAEPGAGTGRRADDVAPPFIGTALATVEVFDPATGRWSPTGSMRFARAGAAATTLSDGRVLVVGPSSSYNDAPGDVTMDARAFGTAEVYDPATGRFTLVGSLPPIDRAAIAADGVEVPTSDPYMTSAGTLVALPDGGALLVGHADEWKHEASVTRTFRFDGSTGRWNQVGPAYAWLNDWNANTTRSTGGLDLAGAFAGPLPDGRVLVAGGTTDAGENAGWNPTRTARAFDPSTGRWSALPPMPEGRDRGATVVLTDGSVLLVGGNDSSNGPVTAIRYVPGR
jgi:N-acetylneuraminic acid mutarotase